MSNSKIIKRVAISAITVLLIVTIGYLILVTSSRIGKTSVQVSIFPGDATVTIDGETAEIGTNYLEPGVYTLEAEKDGFDKHSETVVVEEGNEEKTIGVILNPNTEETLKWAKDNENGEEYEKVFGEAQEAAAEIGKTFNEKNPIAKHLPYKTAIYSVGYRMDKTDPSGNSIIIEIDATDGNRQAALYRIRQLGYDPTDFTINFRDYENPFPL